MTDETRMACLNMAMEVARQTPGTDVVALAERLLGFLTSSAPVVAVADEPKRFSQYREAIEEVAEKHNVSVGEILGEGRLSHICAARWDAIREVYNRHPTLSTVTLGKIFCRDHTSIMYALKKTAHQEAPAVPFPEPKPIRVGSVSISPTAYTVKTFCQAFGVKRTFFYEEVKAGRLQTRKVGTRKVLIRKVDADAWLEQHTKRTVA